jgi:hypothetical protein
VARRESLQRWGRESAPEFAGLDFHDPRVPRGRGRLGLGYPLAWVRARLWRSGLDAALARGADPCGSPALAYRSARLTSERGRERLAASLDRVLDAAARPACGCSAAVPPCRDEVVAAGPLLVQARELLRSRMPVYSQGAARLENLLRDGGSPLYWPARLGALSQELEVAIAALEGRDPADEDKTGEVAERR